MILLNLSPIYKKCGVLLRKTSSLINEINLNSSKFEYINVNLMIDYKKYLLLLFKINDNKLDKFKQSFDYEFIFNKLKNENNKNEEEVCYYCGKLTNKNKKFVNEIFNGKLIEVGKINEMEILGIDYVNNNYNFFILPNQSVNELIKVGNTHELISEKININLKKDLYPFILVNVLEGISIYKVESKNKMVYLGGNSFGSTTLMSLLNLTCGYDDAEYVAKDAIMGNNQEIDLSVGDIYGGDYSSFSLDSDIIASSFGKIGIKDAEKLDKKDIAKSLIILYASITTHAASLHSKKEGVNKILLVGDPFNNNLLLLQMFQTCTEYFSENKVHQTFNDYSDYFEILGMCSKLNKQKLFNIDLEENCSKI